VDGQHVPLPEDQEQQGGDAGPALNPDAPPYVQGPPPAEFWTALIQQLTQQQQQQPRDRQLPRPEKVRLPPLHVSRPKTWFTLAESNFEQQNVTDSRSKFNLILLALNDEQVRRVAAITEAPERFVDPYLALKTRLLEIYQPSKWADVHSILTFKELGSMQPSQLMDELLALHPNNEEPGTLFKGVFLSRLPQDMRDHVQSRADELTCQELARWADHLYDSRNASQAKMLAALPLPPAPDVPVDNSVQQLTDTVAAMQFRQPKSRGAARGRGSAGGARQRGGNQRGGQPRGDNKPPPGLCYTHFKFGSDAYGCKDPQNCMLSPGN